MTTESCKIKIHVVPHFNAFNHHCQQHLNGIEGSIHVMYDPFLCKDISWSKNMLYDLKTTV